MPKTRFTREFQDEAVRLVLTSGRSQRAIADDLGVNRSTLERLRRENEVLRQERDILKKATAFFAREGSR